MPTLCAWRSSSCGANLYNSMNAPLAQPDRGSVYGTVRRANARRNRELASVRLGILSSVTVQKRSFQNNFLNNNFRRRTSFPLLTAYHVFDERKTPVG